MLLVEASALRRQVLTEELEKRGHQVHASTSMDQALELLATVSLDMVVASVNMEEGEGLRLAQRLGDAPETRDLPVLLYSATLRQDRSLGRHRPLEDRLRLIGVIDLHQVPDAVGRGLPARRRSVPRATPAPRAVGPLDSRVGKQRPAHLEDEVLGLQVLLGGDPWAPVLLESLAQRLYILQRFAELAPVCEKLITLGHRAALAWFYAGDVLFHQGKVAPALQAWEQCIAADPADPHAEKALRRIDLANRVLVMGATAAETLAAPHAAAPPSSDPPEEATPQMLI